MEEPDQTLQIIIDLAVKRWQRSTRQVTTFFSTDDTAFYQQTIAPGKNRATWILGHLITAYDELFPLLGFNERYFPAMPAFYYVADRSFEGTAYPSFEELKRRWQLITEKLDQRIKNMPPESWLEPHGRASAEQFKLDPTRNKLAVLLNNFIHTNHHIGQLYLMNQPAPSKADVHQPSK